MPQPSARCTDGKVGPEKTVLEPGAQPPPSQTSPIVPAGRLRLRRPPSEGTYRAGNSHCRAGGAQGAGEARSGSGCRCSAFSFRAPNRRQ